MTFISLLWVWGIISLHVLEPSGRFNGKLTISSRSLYYFILLISMRCRDSQYFTRNIMVKPSRTLTTVPSPIDHEIMNIGVPNYFQSSMFNLCWSVKKIRKREREDPVKNREINRLPITYCPSDAFQQDISNIQNTVPGLLFCFYREKEAALPKIFSWFLI